MLRKVSIRHTLQAVFGLALIILPLALQMIKTWPHMAYVVQGFGFVVTLLTNARVVFLAKNLLDIFWPEEPLMRFWSNEKLAEGSTAAELKMMVVNPSSIKKV